VIVTWHRRSLSRNSPEPIAVERNGTIYGQVIPLRDKNRPGVSVEVHYYHLWAQDCGKPSHALDAESVSVLLQADRPEWRAEAWQASHWYAAAHENTLCDMSNGATAAALRAVDHGANVWISRDKHASFLNSRLCAQGCGKDECTDTTPLQITSLINLGEPQVPMNGAAWSGSTSWHLAKKMKPDFTDALIARIGNKDEADVAPARDVVRGMRTTILVAGDTYWSLAGATSNTGESLGASAAATSTAIGATATSTGYAVKQAGRTVGKSLSATGRSVRRGFRWMGPRQ
jgi:hypothetical protein